MTAGQVLHPCRQVYAACKSYRDSGVVATLCIQTTGKRTVEQPFSTAFVRPDRFRFEYSEKIGDVKKDRYLIWRPREEVRTWWDFTPGVEKPASLHLALAAATGVSGGANGSRPAHFGSDRGGVEIRDLQRLKRLEDAKLGQADCFRVQGRRASRSRGR